MYVICSGPVETQNCRADVLKCELQRLSLKVAEQFHFIHRYTLFRIIYVNIIIIIIIIIFIYCNWVVTRWQWLFYMYTKHEIGYY